MQDTVSSSKERKVLIFPDKQGLFLSAAEEFSRLAIASVLSQGVFRVALAGGSTPKGLYETLTSDSRFRDRIPWAKIEFFWGDERTVPPDHPDSNFLMAQEYLLSKIPIAHEQVHRIEGEARDTVRAASEYEQVIRRAFRTGSTDIPCFDLILLGMGPDGHTASLFPGTSALQEQSRLVVSNWVAKLSTHRITFTATLINQARNVLFMVAGQDKATVLKEVLEGPPNPERLPAQSIQLAQGRLLWMVDADAASRLSNTKRGPDAR